MPDRERIDHVNELASYSQWQDFLATKTIPDSCGIELSEIMAPTVRVVCEALGIPPSSVKTKSQLSHATELLKYSSRDDETNAAIQQQLKEATIATLEDVKTQVSGLGLEAMNKLTALAKGEIMMDTEQIQRLLIGIRRSMFLDLKRQHPDLEQVIAERGDDQAKKFWPNSSPEGGYRGRPHHRGGLTSGTHSGRISSLSAVLDPNSFITFCQCNKSSGRLGMPPFVKMDSIPAKPAERSNASAQAG